MPKSYAEAKRAYDALAKQAAELVAKRPKIHAEIAARVKKECADHDKQFAEVMRKKGEAAVELRAAKVEAPVKSDAPAKPVAPAKPAVVPVPVVSVPKPTA